MRRKQQAPLAVVAAVNLDAVAGGKDDTLFRNPGAPEGFPTLCGMLVSSKAKRSGPSRTEERG
jgi:hypothetical protein